MDILLSKFHHLPLLLLVVSCRHLILASNHDISPLLDSEETYQSWKSKTGQKKYDKYVFLPTSKKDGNGVAIHWSIDTDKGKIRMAAATIAKTWLGFGISEAGGMPGADMFLFTTENDDSPPNGDKSLISGKIVDAYVEEGYVTPKEDTCQDWKLINFEPQNEVLIVETERDLDTGDTQDRAIIDDSNINVPAHRVIAAWGDGELMYHGYDKRLVGSIRFYGQDILDEELFSLTMEKESEGSFDLRTKGFEIPTNETIYQHFCFDASDLQSQGVSMNENFHLVGIEPIIHTETSEYVHHFVLYSVPSSLGDKEKCGEMYGGEMIYVWAPGEGPFTLPLEAGLPLGKDASFFEIQVHYNNPRGDRGFMDDSGIRLYYTSILRKHTMGVLQIGDAMLGLMGEPVGAGTTRHEFLCPSSCTQNHVKGSITVVREMLHMHATGIEMSNEHIREGSVVRAARAEYYDYKQNGMFAAPQEPFVVLPGDSFKTTCHYDTTTANKKDEVLFGLASAEEMCIVFMMYYPKIENIPAGACTYAPFPGASQFLSESCFTSYESKEVNDKETELGRVFGKNMEVDECSTYSPTSSASVNYYHISAILIPMVVSLFIA